MRKYFTISGFWKNDNAGFDNYLVTNFNEYDPKGDFNEEDIFYYGLSESDIKKMIQNPKSSAEDFTITSYKQIN